MSMWINLRIYERLYINTVIMAQLQLLLQLLLRFKINYTNYLIKSNVSVFNTD